ncbi:MAG: hypothetical protein ACYDBV_04650 [Nitrospiria bacterium]
MKIPSPSSGENRIQDWANNILGFLASYLDTYRRVLTNPEKALPKLVSSENQKNQVMLPAAFLVVNILLVALILRLFGFSMPDFPLNLPWSTDFPWIKKIPSAFLPIFLGHIILILSFVSFRDFRRGINHIFPIISYASIVYLPLSVIGKLLSNTFLKLSRDIYGLLFDKGLSQIKWFPYSIKFLFFSILLIGCLMWWLFLLRIGVKSVRNQLPNNASLREPIYAFFYYLVIKTSTFILIIVIFLWPIYEANFQLLELKNALSTNPPKCGTALTLANQISANEALPPYPRYISNLIAAACLPIAFPRDIKMEGIEAAVTAIRESRFSDARNSLEKYVIEFEEDKPKGSKSLYFPMKALLDQADKFHRSPYYIEAKNISVFYGFSGPLITLFP